MKKKKTKTQIPVSTTISRLIIPYLNNYQEKIQSIYLSPYRLGEKEKIEIVIIETSKGIELLEKPKQLENLYIYVNINTLENYTLDRNDPVRCRLDKEVKASYIVYDRKGKLEAKRKKLLNNPEITPFYNSIELSDETVKHVKSNIRSIRIK